MASDGGQFSEGHPPTDSLAKSWPDEWLQGIVPLRERSGDTVPRDPSEGTPTVPGSGDGDPGGVPSTGSLSAEEQSIHQQAFYLGEALKIFATRNATRNDAWRGAGAKGQLVELRKKLDRLWARWDGEVDQKDIDEALDLINAAVFWIRCIAEGNNNGKWPWP